MKARTTERTVYRNLLANTLVWIMMTFGTLVFLVDLVEDAELNKPAAIMVIDAVCMVAFLVPAVRFPYNGVIALPTEVVVRNIMKTHRIAWSEIERFEMAKYDPWPQVGVVVLRSGRRIPMTALQFALATTVAQRAVADLNRQLSARTGKDSTADDYPTAKPSSEPRATSPGV